MIIIKIIYFIEIIFKLNFSADRDIVEIPAKKTHAKLFVLR
jgi:hypothetical protein